MPMDAKAQGVLVQAEQAAAAAGTPIHVPPITGILEGPADLTVSPHVHVFAARACVRVHACMRAVR